MHDRSAMTLFGLLNVNKPAGATSRDVVNQIQRLVKPTKVGHAGTLDPLARGVLVIGLGQATRLVEYVQQMPKHYRATFLLGRTSPTEDIEGEVTMLADAAPPRREDLEQSALTLTGEIMQRPPAYSALKVAGRRAYALARAGETVELAPRAVRIDRMNIVRYEYPELCLEVVCGSGTYIRSLGRDLAEAVGSGAVMSQLERTAIGRFTIDTAVDPKSLTRENLAAHLLPAAWAVQGLMSEQVVSTADAARLANGLPIAIAEVPSDVCAAVDGEGRLLAILTRQDGDQFTPLKYLPQL
jgi:tRNA pseudouridine55 synthase